MATIVLQRDWSGGAEHEPNGDALRSVMTASIEGNVDKEISLAGLDRTEAENRSLASEALSRVDPAPKAALPLELASPSATDQIAVRVLDRAGQAVEGVNIVARSPGRHRFSSSQYWEGLSGASGSPATLSCDQFRSRKSRGESTVEICIQHVGLSVEPVTVDLSELPSEPVDIVIAEPFGSLLLRFVDDTGEPLGEWVDVSLRSQASAVNLSQIAVNQPNPSCAPGASVRLVPVALGKRLSGMAAARAGWTPVAWESSGPNREGETKVETVQFAQPLPTVAFRLTPLPGVKWPSGSRVKAQFLPDQVEGPYLFTRLDERDGRQFVATVSPASMAGQLGRLQISVEPKRSYSTRVSDNMQALEASIQVQLPALRENLDAGDISVQRPQLTTSGRVVDSEGRGVRRARVVFLTRSTSGGSDIWKSASESRSLVADQEGRFEITPGARAKAEAIRAVHSPLGASQPIVLQGASGEILLQLEPAVSLSGRVLLPEGVEAEGMRVKVLESNEPVLLESIAFVEPDGSFELTSVSAKRIDLGLYPEQGIHPIARLDDVPVLTRVRAMTLDRTPGIFVKTSKRLIYGSNCRRARR